MFGFLILCCLPVWSPGKRNDPSLLGQETLHCSDLPDLRPTFMYDPDCPFTDRFFEKSAGCPRFEIDVVSFQRTLLIFKQLFF